MKIFGICSLPPSKIKQEAKKRELNITVLDFFSFVRKFKELKGTVIVSANILQLTEIKELIPLDYVMTHTSVIQKRVNWELLSTEQEVQPKELKYLPLHTTLISSPYKEPFIRSYLSFIQNNMLEENTHTFMSYLLDYLFTNQSDKKFYSKVKSLVKSKSKMKSFDKFFASIPKGLKQFCLGLSQTLSEKEGNSINYNKALKAGFSKELMKFLMKYKRLLSTAVINVNLNDLHIEEDEVEEQQDEE